MSAQPPYERLARAETKVRNDYPGAHRIKALWCPAGEFEIVVEVQPHRRGRAFSVNPGRLA